jgi:hypothetical protein
LAVSGTSRASKAFLTANLYQDSGTVCPVARFIAIARSINVSACGAFFWIDLICASAISASMSSGLASASLVSAASAFLLSLAEAASDA